MKELSLSDLRVGNIVTDEFYDSFKTFIKVDSIGENGINLTIQDDGGYPECCQHWLEPEIPFDKLFGIPLTQEILSKIPSIDGWIIDNRFECRENFGDSVSIYAWKNGKSIFIVDLNFLHELQNWYYLHARKELEIKL